MYVCIGSSLESICRLSICFLQWRLCEYWIYSLLWGRLPLIRFFYYHVPIWTCMLNNWACTSICAHMDVHAQQLCMHVHMCPYGRACSTIGHARPYVSIWTCMLNNCAAHMDVHAQQLCMHVHMCPYGRACSTIVQPIWTCMLNNCACTSAWWTMIGGRVRKLFQTYANRNIPWNHTRKQHGRSLCTDRKQTLNRQRFGTLPA